MVRFFENGYIRAWPVLISSGHWPPGYVSQFWQNHGLVITRFTSNKNMAYSWESSTGGKNWQQLEEDGENGIQINQDSALQR
jgi:hypothetical protein